MAASIIKSQKITALEYVANVYWGDNTWTCPEDGVATASITTDTSSGAAYWYIYDRTLDGPAANMNQTANGLSQTVSFPVIKGHVYGTAALSGVDTANAFYYKYV